MQSVAAKSVTTFVWYQSKQDVSAADIVQRLIQANIECRHILAINIFMSSIYEVSAMRKWQLSAD
jgi:hypothetical protein